jgi:hypothetical protein
MISWSEWTLHVYCVNIDLTTSAFAKFMLSMPFLISIIVNYAHASSRIPFCFFHPRCIQESIAIDIFLR